MEKVQFVFVHEAMHIFHKSSERAERIAVPSHGPLAKLWNICSDKFINHMLDQALGFHPDDACMPCSEPYPLPRSMINATTEEAYFYLLDKLEQKDSATEHTAKCLSGKCGSGAGNKVLGEVDASHPAARSPAAITAIVKQAALAVAQEQREHGNIPDGLLRDVQAILAPPKVPWSRVLQRKIRAAVGRRLGAVDFGFHALSRRQGALSTILGSSAPILPKLFAPELLVEVVIDTSGSMGARELAACLRETQGVLRAVGAKIRFTAIDAIIQSEKELTNLDQALTLLKGGGGTDFRPLFERLPRRPKSKRPQIVVFMTDGFGPAPETPPKDVHVIWLLIGEEACRPFKNTTQHIDWGDAVYIHD